MKKLALAALMLLAGCSNYVDLDKLEATKLYCESRGAALKGLMVQPLGTPTVIKCTDSATSFDYKQVEDYFVAKGLSNE